MPGTVLNTCVSHTFSCNLQNKANIKMSVVPEMQKSGPGQGPTVGERGNPEVESRQPAIGG